MHTSIDLAEMAKSYIPGGCVGATRLPDDLGLVFEQASGCRITDQSGRSFIDFVMGSGPLLLGHAYPSVVEAVTSQIAKGSTYYALSPPAVSLAKRIVEAVPCAQGVRFQTTGSEATWAALRLARAATGRAKVLRFEGGLHGGNDLGLVSHTPPRLSSYPEPVADCAGISPGILSEILVAPFNDLPTTRSIVEAAWQDIAAIIVEPIQRVITPAAGFLEGLRKLADHYGIVLIFDEVVTGFRMARGGAQELFGVRPDLATYGKVIGGGFPLSAIAGKWDLLSLADPLNKPSGRYAFMSGTLTANPVSCAAGEATLATLEAIAPYQALEEKSRNLAEGLRAAARSRDVSAIIVQVGSLIQVLFDAPDELRNYRDFAAADARKGIQFGHELIRRGINVVPGGKLYVSTAHGDDDLETTLAAAREAFGVVGA
jgi:glutamate-1-semialdehyde 2,1-aminomutase